MSIIGGFPVGAGLGQTPKPPQSELDEVLDRLGRAWASLRNENIILRERLESVTRPAAPTATGNSVNPVEPVRSTLGTRIYDMANEMFAETDNVRSFIERLAV